MNFAHFHRWVWVEWIHLTKFEFEHEFNLFLRIWVWISSFSFYECAQHWVQHCQNSKSVMIWVRICTTGKTALTFINFGVIINKKCTKGDFWECGTFSKLREILCKWSLDVFSRFYSFSLSEIHIGLMSDQFSKLHFGSTMAKLTCLSSTPWIIVCGQFFRQWLVQNLTKIWKLWSVCWFRNRSKSFHIICSKWLKISLNVCVSASNKREYTLKIKNSGNWIFISLIFCC